MKEFEIELSREIIRSNKECVTVRVMANSEDEAERLVENYSDLDALPWRLDDYWEDIEDEINGEVVESVCAVEELWHPNEDATKLEITKEEVK